MSVDEIVEAILRKAKSFNDGSGGVNGAAVFTQEIIDAIARLSPDDLETFKVKLEAEMLLNGIKIRKVTARKIDFLVAAAQARMLAEAEESRLSESLPEAPNSDRLVVPAGWEVTQDGVRFLGFWRAAGAPVFLDARLADRERAKTFLRMVVLTDGGWRTVLVPASASDRKMASAVMEAGVFVYSPKLVGQFLRAFLARNWDALEVVDIGSEQDALFEDWRDYVAENARSFFGKWGMTRITKDGSRELMVLPEVVHKFLKSRGASPHAALWEWRRRGYLICPQDGVLSTRWFGKRSRRMAVFPADLFDLAADEPLRANIGGAC